MKVEIKKSTNSKKKLMAIFYEGDKKIKTVHFGASGYTDYIKSGGDDGKKKKIYSPSFKW